MATSDGPNIEAVWDAFNSAVRARAYWITMYLGLKPLLQGCFKLPEAEAPSVEFPPTLGEEIFGSVMPEYFIPIFCDEEYRIGGYEEDFNADYFIDDILAWHRIAGLLWLASELKYFKVQQFCENQGERVQLFDFVRVARNLVEHNHSKLSTASKRDLDRWGGRIVWKDKVITRDSEGEFSLSHTSLDRLMRDVIVELKNILIQHNKEPHHASLMLAADIDEIAELIKQMRLTNLLPRHRN